MSDRISPDPQLDPDRIPSHVAVIMDGNGRWARQRDLPRWEGHRAGMAAVREVIEGAAEIGVQHLTLFAFSQENWRRPPEEIEALMALLDEYVASESAELVERGVRVSVFGERERLSDGARASIARLEGATAGGRQLDVHLAISYGARHELAAAARRLARRCVSGDLRPDDIDEAAVAAELMTADWPDPDLMVRTSGELRISNFLLWQLAYAELYVTPILWPDFDRAELVKAIQAFQARDRRFGAVSSS